MQGGCRTNARYDVIKALPAPDSSVAHLFGAKQRVVHGEAVAEAVLQLLSMQSARCSGNDDNIRISPIDTPDRGLGESVNGRDRFQKDDQKKQPIDADGGWRNRIQLIHRRLQTGLVSCGGTVSGPQIRLQRNNKYSYRPFNRDEMRQPEAM